MKIYVKSRGGSQDYCWLDAETGIELDKPPELPKFKVDIDDFSLILQRQGTQLALLVTGLISSKRVDYQNRKIRNSVLWITDDESCLRGLTIQALGEEDEPLGEQLAAQLDEMIYSTTTEPGFQVDFSKMKNLAKQAKHISRLESSEPSALEGKIGNLSTFKEDLQNELMQSSFPKVDGLFLVVVSPTLSHNNLDKDKIWRVLSNQVDSDDGWITLPLKKKPGDLIGVSTVSRKLTPGNASHHPGPRNLPPELFQRAKIVLAWLGWVVALILAVTLFMVYQENQDLTQEKRQLQEDKETLAEEKETLAEENRQLTNTRSEGQELIEKGSENGDEVMNNNLPQVSPRIIDEPE